MDNQTKNVQTLWWSLNVPSDWGIEYTRSGVNFRPDVNESSIVEVICLKRDINNITEIDFLKYVSKDLDVNEIEKIKSYMFVRREKYVDSTRYICWGIGCDKYLIVANYNSKNDSNDTSKINQIEKVLRGMHFSGA